MTESSHDPLRLLGDQRFLRRLARSLAGDEGWAEDAVQETFVLAIESEGARLQSRRAWLATVLRRVLARRGVRESQRAHVERGAARPEAIEVEHGEVEQRLALAAELADAVHRLREPFRTTVYLRYARELSAAEIATRLELPIATVKSRLRRGLAELRDVLDRRWGGRREAWVVLASRPMAALQGSSGVSLAGGMLVKKLVLAVVVALALLGGGWFVVGSVGSKPVDGRGLEAPIARGSTKSSEAVHRAGGPAADKAAAERTLLAAQAGPATAPVVASAEFGQARLSGRIVDVQQRPLEGVECRVFGRDGSSGRVEEFGRRLEPVTLTSATDAHGCFTLKVPAVPSFSYRFEANVAGRVSEGLPLDPLVPGEARDLGVIAMRPAARLRGRLVGAGGRAPAGDWTVNARAADPELGAGRVEVRASLPVDPATGEFSWDAAPPGEARVRATGPGAWIDERAIELTAGETGEITLVYAGPDVSARVALRVQRAFRNGCPRTEHVRLLDAEGEDVGIVPSTPYEGGFWFDGVAPGAYTLVIDDPDFQSWSRAGVQPGDAVVLDELLGSAGLALELVDERGDPVVAPFTLIQLHSTGDAQRKPSRYALHLRDEPLVDGVVWGLRPGPMRVELNVAGFVGQELELPELRAGEVLPFRAELQRGGKLGGRVVRADGRPAAGLVVRLATPAQVADSNDSYLLELRHTSSNPERNRHEVQRSMTDQAGGFRFEELLSGSYLVVVDTVSQARTTAGPFQVTAGERSADVEVSLPALGQLRGEFRGAPGTTFEGTHVALVDVYDETRILQPGFQSSHSGYGPVAPVGADGEFLVPELEPGPWDLYLVTRSRPAGGAEWQRGDVRWYVDRVHVGQGDSRPHLFDLGEAAPRTLEVRVEAGGEAVPLAVVLATNYEERSDRAHIAQAGYDGVLRLGPLFAGTWNVEVESDRRDWWVCLEQPLVVGPGMPARLDIELELIPGVVRLVRADDGRALSETRVLVAPGNGVRNGGRYVETDALGRVELLHHPGSIRIMDYYRTRGNRPQDWTRVPWPPPPGEEPVIRLP